VESEWNDIMSRIPCPGFEHLAHTADVLVACKGRTLEELFEQAAKAVYEIITDTSSVREDLKIELEEEGIDVENLLYRFIEALLYYTDAEGLVFSRVEVKRIYRPDDAIRLEAYALGEKFDPDRHEHRTIVKAMTYAQMRVSRTPDGCFGATFVPDI